MSDGLINHWRMKLPTNKIRRVMTEVHTDPSQGDNRCSMGYYWGLNRVG